MQEPTEAPASWMKRIGWLILIWTASVLTLGILALAIRYMMNLAGLTT